MTRVKKIIHADDDLATCSNNAAFAIAVATEQFLQYLVEQTHHVVKAERKPRRNIQYRDVANAVARHDNLEFLTDVVPRTVTYKVHKEKAAKEKQQKLEEQQLKLAGGLPNGANLQIPGASGESGSRIHDPTAQDKPDHAGPEVMDIDVVVDSPSKPVNGVGHG